MLAKPTVLIDREREWTALERFVARRQRLATSVHSPAQAPPDLVSIEPANIYGVDYTDGV